MSECSGSYYVSGIKVRSGQGVVVIDGVPKTVVAGVKAGDGEINYKDLKAGHVIHVEAPDGVRIPLAFNPERASGRKGRGELDLSIIPDEHKVRALETALVGLPLDSRESRKYAEKVHEEARDFAQSGFVGHHNMGDMMSTLLKRRGEVKAGLENDESNKHLQEELKRVDETIKTLTGLDMSNSDMSNSDMSGMDLSGSNMSGSDMSGSNMSGSNMSGSNMSGSNMSGSNMSGSNMSGSDLSDVDLSGADLSGADLSGADLSGAGGRGIKWDENTKWPEGFDPERDFKESPSTKSTSEDEAKAEDMKEGPQDKNGEQKPGEKKPGEQQPGEKKPGEPKPGEKRADGSSPDKGGEQKPGEQETGAKKTDGPGAGKDGEKKPGEKRADGSSPDKGGEQKPGEKRADGSSPDKGGEQKPGEQETGAKKTDGPGAGKGGEKKPGGQRSGDGAIGYSRDRRGSSKSSASWYEDGEAQEAYMTGDMGAGGGKVRGRESAPEKSMRLAAKRAAERISSMRYRDADPADDGVKRSLQVIISPDVSGSTSAWSGTSEAFSKALSSVSGTRVSVTPNVNGEWGVESMFTSSDEDTQGAMARRLLGERSVLIYMGDNHGTDRCQEMADAGASVIALDAGWQVGMHDGAPSGRLLAERTLSMESSETGEMLNIVVRTHDGEHGGKLHWVSGVPMDSPLEWAASIDAVMKNLEELEAGTGGGERNIGSILDRGQTVPPDEEVVEASKDIGEYLVSIGEESAASAMRFILSPDLSPSTSEWNPIAEAVTEHLSEIPGVSSSIVINSNGAWYADSTEASEAEAVNSRMSAEVSGGAVLVYLGDDQGYEHCQTVASSGGVVIGVSSDPSPKGDFSDRPIVDVEQHGSGRVLWVSNVPTDTPALVSEGIQEALRVLQSEKPASQIVAPVVEGKIRMAAGRKPVPDSAAVNAAREVQRAIARLPQAEESRRQVTSGREWDTEKLATLSSAGRDPRPARVPKIKHQKKMVVSFDTSPSTVGWSGTGETFAREIIKSRVLEGTVLQNSNGALIDPAGSTRIEEADIVVYLGDEDGLAEFEKHVDKEKAIVALCVSDSKETQRAPMERRSGGGWIYRATGLPSDQPAAWAVALVRATKKLANKW